MFEKLNKTFIIAEIGNNHEGDFATAKKMILEAKKSGADAIKFQTIIPELYIIKKDKKRINQLKKFQFSFDQFKKLSDYAKKIKILFLSTPFDVNSAIFLNKIQSFFKISSGDNNYFQLIKKISSFNKSIILSTGLADIDLISKTKKIILKEWKKKPKIKKKLVLMHCVSSYPVDPQDANLSAIKSLKETFKDCTIGYSDHTIGILAPSISVIYGAKVIEKHFTLNKNQSSFRDHKLSADPNEMKQLVKNIRNIEMMIGDGEKKIEKGERDSIKFMRRSAIASKNINKGEQLSNNNIKWLRSKDGIKIDLIDKILKNKASTNIKRDTIIKNKNLITKIK
jgi:N,N'-diacetyllegionaminate synthase